MATPRPLLMLRRRQSRQATQACLGSAPSCRA